MFFTYAILLRSSLENYKHLVFKIPKLENLQKFYAKGRTETNAHV